MIELNEILFFGSKITNNDPQNNKSLHILDGQTFHYKMVFAECSW